MEGQGNGGVGESMASVGSKIVRSIIAMAVCFIPVWLNILARLVFKPEGFWQNLVLTGLGIYVLGGLQVLLFIALCIWLCFIWSK